MARLTKDNVKLGMGATTLGWSDPKGYLTYVYAKKNGEYFDGGKPVIVGRSEYYDYNF